MGALYRCRILEMRSIQCGEHHSLGRSLASVHRSAEDVKDAGGFVGRVQNIVIHGQAVVDENSVIFNLVD